MRNKASSKTATLLSVTPLSARSLVLSLMLGTRPARFTASSLIAVCQLFDFNEGTIRTALSRMVASNELNRDGSYYVLGDRLLERQKMQDAGRHLPNTDWDGRWYTAIAAADQRSVNERRSFRAVMLANRFGEWRADIWLRPATSPFTPPAGVLLSCGPISGMSDTDLVSRLWDLDELEAEATRIADALPPQLAQLAERGGEALPDAMAVAVEAVRFLTTEPQLPPSLTQEHHEARRLRTSYDAFEVKFQQTVASVASQARTAQ